MARTVLFRTSFIGGYNRADVMEYVEKLEREIEYLRSVKEKARALEKSVSELLENQEIFVEEAAGLKQNIQEMPKETDIENVSNGNVNVCGLAEKIIQEAERRAEENTKEARMLAAEMKDSADRIQKQVRVIQVSMQALADRLPTD